MAFNEEKRKYSNMLRKIGAVVEVHEANHELTVNGKYVFNYANYYFRRIAEIKSIGRGIKEFMDFIVNDK